MRTLFAPLLAALLALPVAASARQLGELRFEKCELPVVGLRPTNPINGECTRLTVPEDWANPDGRQIELALALIPARAAKAEADPVLMLAGGPGQSARESWRQVAGAFRNVLAKRNVLLLDQRGTGDSHRYSCPQAEDSALMESAVDPALVAQMAQECIDHNASTHDPRHYGTEDAARDLERLRQAVGAPNLNLVGVSYGTRMAQIYTKRYPDRVRTLVLDSMVPNELILGSEHAINLETSLQTQLGRCAEDAACQQRFGDPYSELRTLADELAQQPRMLQLRHPRTGEATPQPLNRGALAMLARMYAYSPETIALLPITLAEARAGRFEPLLAQATMLSEDLGAQISMGMHWSVVCTEDAPFMQDRPEDAGLLLGNDFVSMIRAWCGVWPSKPLPADYREPVSGPVPALLLSGENDPVTPARYGDQVAANLPNSRHLVAPGQGHSVLGRGCLPRLMTEFIDTANAAALDAECLQQLSPAPFYLNLSGAAP